MLTARASWRAPIFAVFLLWCQPVSAQDLALTTESEFGFQRLIHAAQTGKLGDDVTNANVFVLKNRVRVELVRKGGANKILLLTHKASRQSWCRYFDIEPGDGATPADAARLGNVLDVAFPQDPFQVAWDFFGVYSHEPIPSLPQAWRDGGRKGVQRVLESYLIAATGVRYAVAVIGAVVIGLCASLVLLWGSDPRRATGPQSNRRL